MKAKLFLHFGLAVIALALAASPAAAQNLNWSTAEPYGDGEKSSLAVHSSGLVLEFHTTEALTGKSLWYHVGKIDGGRVSWGGSQRLPADGYWPNVAITREGYVLFVWSTGTYKSNSELYYMVGKIDPNGDVNQSISWLTQGKHFDSGFHSSIAMNDNGVIVEVHESGSGGTGLYYRVGQFANPPVGDFSIVWRTGPYGQYYGDGINPHIAINNRNEVVEVHQVTDEWLLHYHRGVVLSGGVIDFRPSQRYDDNASEAAVGLRDDGLLVEIHRYGYDKRAYARPGSLSLSNPDLIDWSGPVKVSVENNDGSARYPSVGMNQSYVVGSWAHTSAGGSVLYSAVASLP